VAVAELLVDGEAVTETEDSPEAKVMSRVGMWESLTQAGTGGVLGVSERR